MRAAGMKYRTIRFTDLKAALKEIEQFVRDPQHLQTGKPVKQFGNLRPRELLTNWLMCAACNYECGSDRLTFTSDPTGGDGILLDTQANETFTTEHVILPAATKGKTVDLESRILSAIRSRKTKRQDGDYRSQPRQFDGSTSDNFTGVDIDPRQHPRQRFRGSLVKSKGQTPNSHDSHDSQLRATGKKDSSYDSSLISEPPDAPKPDWFSSTHRAETEPADGLDIPVFLRREHPHVFSKKKISADARLGDKAEVESNGPQWWQRD
jgi:hypothetical protein